MLNLSLQEISGLVDWDFLLVIEGGKNILPPAAAKEQCQYTLQMSVTFRTIAEVLYGCAVQEARTHVVHYTKYMCFSFHLHKH